MAACRARRYAGGGLQRRAGGYGSYRRAEVSCRSLPQQHRLLCILDYCQALLSACDVGGNGCCSVSAGIVCLPFSAWSARAVACCDLRCPWRRPEASAMPSPATPIRRLLSTAFAGVFRRMPRSCTDQRDDGFNFPGLMVKVAHDSIAVSSCFDVQKSSEHVLHTSTAGRAVAADGRPRVRTHLTNVLLAFRTW